MGLAGVKVKQRFGLDPRNTGWSNDTSRFGHQYLEKMGWKPGKGLGLVEHAMTTHVKVSIKDNNLGLGAKLAKKNKDDPLDGGETAGLDAFQRILGRLNGKEEQVNKELERQRTDNIINGKWGMKFIKGDVLKSTWDSSKKELLNGSETKKRKSDESSSDRESKRRKGKSRDEKRSDKRDKRIKDRGENSEETTENKEKKQKKEKKDKKEKKEKKEKKNKINKVRKEKSIEISTSKTLEPTLSKQAAISTRLSVRSKWIKQKRASVMDAKALNEIFMIAS